MSTQNNETTNFDPPPVTVNDGGEPTQIVEQQQQPAQQQQNDAAPEVKLTHYEDPRDRIAAAQRAKREAESEPFINQQGLPVFDDPPDDGAQNEQNTQQGAAQKAAPSDSGTGQMLNLTVNRNNFSVSREDAMRYADIDASEADLYTDIQIVRLAQKHLAAQQLLDEAKATRNSARAARADGSQPGDDDNAANQEQQSQQPVQVDHHSKRAEVIEALQFEDPATAGEKLDAYISDLVDNKIVGRTKAATYKTVQQDIMTIAAEIEAEHPDITQDRYASVVAKELLLDEAADELVRNAGLSKQQVDWLRDNNKLVEAYAAAQVDGIKVRPPREVFESAVTKTRAELGRPAPRQVEQQQPQQQQQPGTHDRFAAKRGLIQQPTRNVTQQQNNASQPVLTVEQSRKAAIMQRRAEQQRRLG